MYYNPSKRLTVFMAALVLVTIVIADEPNRLFYVQSAHLDLKAEPNTSAKTVGTLKRGDALTVSENKDHWVKGNSGAFTGWTSKVFLSPHKPVGQADLAKEVPTTMEKASRRRPQSYTVNAAARGLTEDESAREGGDGFKTDYKALKKVEGRKVPEGELKQFKESAKLPQ